MSNTYFLGLSGERSGVTKVSCFSQYACHLASTSAKGYVVGVAATSVGSLVVENNCDDELLAVVVVVTAADVDLQTEGRLTKERRLRPTFHDEVVLKARADDTSSVVVSMVLRKRAGCCWVGLCCVCATKKEEGIVRFVPIVWAMCTNRAVVV